MIELSKEDREYIKRNSGTTIARTIIDHISVLEKDYGHEIKKDIMKGMDEIGYNLDIFNIKPGDNIPVSHYMAFFVVKKELFSLDEEGVKDIGRKIARISFLLKFTSRLFVSLEMVAKNANSAWRKYYEKGDIRITEADSEKRRLVIELDNFVGHPLHCKHLEGYLEQIVFFVVGKKVLCTEEECLFRDGSFHRYILTWD